MAATDNDALLKAMDQLMKEEDRASVIEYAKQLSTKGGDVVGTMRKMSQQGVDTKKDAAMWKKRALLTAAAAVVVCAVMFGLMVASAEVTKEIAIAETGSAGSGRRLDDHDEQAVLTDVTNEKVVGAGVADGTIDLSAAAGGGKRRRLASGALGGIDSGAVKAISHTADTLRRLDASDAKTEAIYVKADVTSTTTWPAQTKRRLDADGREAEEETTTRTTWETGAGCFTCDVSSVKRVLDGRLLDVVDENRATRFTPDQPCAPPDGKRLLEDAGISSGTNMAHFTCKDKSVCGNVK